MKISLATIGSRGDVQPVIALGLGLKAAGHTVGIMAPPDFQSFVESYGFTYYPLGKSMKEIMDENLETYGKKSIPITRIRDIMHKQLEAQFEQIPDKARDSDILIGAGPLFGGISIAELLKIPYLYIVFSAPFFPSREYPPSMTTPNHYMAPWKNKFIWFIGKFYNNSYFKKHLNQTRKKYGLGPIKDYTRYLISADNLVTIDKEIAPVPQDVKARYTQIPPLLLSAAGQQLDPLISAFLDAGPAPLYIGFGSMPIANPQEATSMLIEIAAELKIRIIIDKGWAELGNVTIPENILVISGAPHDLLFPRTAGVIHHAGAGTLSTAARAGVPQIAIPTAFDQFYLAKRIFVSGIGPKGCPVFELNREYLISAIKEIQNNQAMIQKAKELGLKLRETNGVQEAVKIIEAKAQAGK